MKAKTESQIIIESLLEAYDNATIHHPEDAFRISIVRKAKEFIDKEERISSAKKDGYKPWWRDFDEHGCVDINEGEQEFFTVNAIGYMHGIDEPQNTDNADMIINSRNSYAKNCENPYQAAKDDLLGKALEALRLISKKCHSEHDSVSILDLEVVDEVIKKADGEC